MNRFFALTKNLLLTIKHYGIIKFNHHFFEQTTPVLILQLSNYDSVNNSTNQSINELMQDGILWGVPKKRRTVEKRLQRRFGVENYPDTARILRTRDDLVICERCGDHHEYYAICYTCYEKVKEETMKIREKMREQIDPLQPKEKEVLFQYENDSNDENNDNVDENFRKNLEKYQIIKLDHKRPKWFSQNLLTKSTRSMNYNPKNVTISANDLIDNHKK